MRAQKLLTLIFMVFVCSSQQCIIDPFFEISIQEYLAPFNEGVTDQMLEKVNSISGTEMVTIKDGKVVGKLYQEGLNSLFSLVAPQVPDIKFVLNTQDLPRLFKNPVKDGQDWRQFACDKGYKKPKHGIFLRQKPNRDNDYLTYLKAPLFSPSTIPECFMDIVIPCIGCIALGHLQKEKMVPWEQKQFKAFWRGGPTGGYIPEQKTLYTQYHRQRLVALCLKNEDCDARFHQYQDKPVYKEMEKIYGPPDNVPYLEQTKYKIIIDIDGNSYSARFGAVLSLGAAVFKIKAFQDIATIIAQPWRHYIPVKMDLSDFEQRLRWAKENDDQLRKIAERGRKMSQKMNYEHYKCYTQKLLQSYAVLYNLGHNIELKPQDQDKKVQDKQKLQEKDKNLQEKQKHLQDKQKNLQKKGKNLQEKQKHLQEKQKYLQEKDKKLQEKDKKINEKEKHLKEKDKDLQEKQKHLQEKDKKIKEKQKYLQEKEKYLQEKEKLQMKEEHLQKKEKYLQEKDKNLQEKNNKLQEKGKMLQNSNSFYFILLSGALMIATFILFIKTKRTVQYQHKIPYERQRISQRGELYEKNLSEEQIT